MPTLKLPLYLYCFVFCFCFCFCLFCFCFVLFCFVCFFLMKLEHFGFTCNSLNRHIGFSYEIVPITVFFILWLRKLYHWIKSRNKSDFPVVLGKLYTDIYNLPRFFVQDLCENTPQRPLKHQKCHFRRSIYIFYNNIFPQNKEL